MARSWQQEAARYSGTGIQAAAFLAAIVWLGRWADSYFALKGPYLTAAAALFGSIAVTIWLIVRLSPRKSLPEKNDDRQEPPRN